MEFHSKKDAFEKSDIESLPISKVYDLKNENDAMKAVEDMVNLGFKDKKEGFKVLMPKETKLAKRIGYTITTGVVKGLGQKHEIRNVRHWTYHHDDEHYAIVLIHNSALKELEF
jgi:hypothetical protein